MTSLDLGPPDLRQATQCREHSRRAAQNVAQPKHGHCSLSWGCEHEKTDKHVSMSTTKASRNSQDCIIASYNVLLFQADDTGVVPYCRGMQGSHLANSVEQGPVQF